jgi:O-antigen/teichoic acid export membrane protein
MMQRMHLDRDSALTAAEPLPAPAATILELDDGRSRPGSLTRDSILFGLGSLVGKSVGFLTLPLFARLMSPEAFGRLDVLNALVSSGLLILLFGTDVAAVRLFFDRPSPEGQRRLFSTWLTIGLLVVAIPAGVLVVGADQFGRALFGVDDLALAVALVGITLIGGIVHFVTLGVLRATGRPLAYALLEGGALSLNAGLAVALLAGWRPDATAVMLALAVSWGGAAVVGLVTVRDSIVARPSIAAGTALLALALPLAPAIAATWGADFFHRAFLLGAAGATQAAFLSVATRVASVAMLVVAAAQLAWHPHAYRLGVSRDAMARLATEGRQIVVALVACVGILGVATPEILAVIGGSPYRGAAPATGLGLVSVLGVGLFTIGSLPSAVVRRTRDLGVAIVAGVVVAVGLNVMLAASLGAFGTAGAIVAGQSVTAGIAIALGSRRLPIPYAWSRLTALIGVAAVVVIGSTYSPDVPALQRIALAALLLVALGLDGTLPAAMAERIRRRRAASKDG